MNTSFKYIILMVLFGVMWYGPRAAADTLSLAPDARRINLAPYLSVFNDVSRTLGVTDMRSKDIEGRFRPSGSSNPNFGYTDDVYWFRFNIEHAGKEPRQVFLVIDNPLLDDVRLFYPIDGSYAVLMNGDGIPFSDRPIKNRNLVFPLTLKTGTNSCYLRVHTLNSIAFQATVWDPDYFYERDNAEQIILWMYYGLMLGFLLFNLFLMFSIRDLSYFYYTLFIAFYVVFRVTYNGLGFQYFWPGNIWWNSNSFIVLIALAVICFILFTRSFLRIARISPLLDKILAAFIAAYVLAVPLQVAMGYRGAIQFILILSVATTFLLFFAGIVAMAKKERESYFYLVAWSFFLAGSLLNILKDLSVLPVNFITIWSQQIGSALTALFLTFGLADRINTMKRIVTDAHDELIKTYASLDQERELLSTTLRSIADAVITTDLSGAIVTMNKAAEAVTGWSLYDAAGRPCGEIFNICSSRTGMSYDIFLEKVKSGAEKFDVELDVMLVSRDEAKKSIAFSMAPIRDRDSLLIGTVIVFRDITERLKTEKEMLQTSKLKALGTFAGGLAHDFNNILTVIVGNLSLVKQMARQDRGIVELVADTEKISFRARDLTQQLLTFSRGGDPVKRITDVGRLLRDTSSFILSGSKIKIDFSIQEGLWNAEVDEGQISQALDNIVINAMQAMPDGGTMLVSAENLRDEAGDLIRIEIQDQGKGIPEEILGRIFDPFFTTKPDGTGLGLSIAHSIIKKHGGTINVDSEKGIGSVFSITLPALPDGSPAETKNKGSIVGGRGKLLVMDDEDLVLKTACKMAQSMGYRADPALNGQEVLELHRAALDARAPYDAIIMDLTVPGGMGGREAIGKLRETDATVKVIVSSGYSNDPVMANHRDYGFDDIIVKPYGIEELSQALNRVMKDKNS